MKKILILLILCIGQTTFAQLATNAQTTDGKPILYNEYPGDIEIHGSLSVSNIFPNSSNDSLGSAERPWKDVYVSTGSIYIGETKLSVTTNGNLAVGTMTKLTFDQINSIIEGLMISDANAAIVASLKLLAIDAEAKREGGLKWWDTCEYHPEIVE